MHRLLVGNTLAYEYLTVNTDNLVACQQPSPVSRAALDNILYAQRIITDDKLNPHTRERTFEIVRRQLYILCTDIDRMRVQL